MHMLSSQLSETSFLKRTKSIKNYIPLIKKPSEKISDGFLVLVFLRNILYDKV